MLIRCLCSLPVPGRIICLYRKCLFEIAIILKMLRSPIPIRRTVRAGEHFWNPSAPDRISHALSMAVPEIGAYAKGQELLDYCSLGAYCRCRTRSTTAGVLHGKMKRCGPGFVFTSRVTACAEKTAHGGSASDAFDIVIPSLPGYGFSAKTTAPGWDVPRISRAWITLMKRLGSLPPNGVDFISMDGSATLPYDIPNIKIEYTEQDPGIPYGFWRSVGASFQGFAVEAFVDELASTAGKDPYEFRKGLLSKAPRHLAALNLAADIAIQQELCSFRQRDVNIDKSRRRIDSPRNQADGPLYFSSGRIVQRHDRD